MEPENTPQRSAWQPVLREIVQTVLISVVLYALITTVVGRYEVLNISMEPTFHQGQRILVNRSERLLPFWMTHAAHASSEGATEYSLFKRGQVAVFYPTDARDEDPLIKRVIALPGDHLAIHDGRVWINGEAVSEPYVHGVQTDCSRYCDLTLPAGEYFMMGDNRNHGNSYDSRMFGPVLERNVIGQVVLRYWPLDKVEVFP
jgi:signal peptidase I